MDATVVASGEHEPSPSGSVSVPMVVGAAVLCGLGIMGMVYWLVTFKWLLFASVIPLIAGAYLLFTRATGADHA